MKTRNSRYSQFSVLSPQYYLLSAFGKDRPGIVAKVTRTVFELKGNIEDASMTRLGGEFSMMLVVSLPKAFGRDRFLASLPALEHKLDLTLLAKPLSKELAHTQHQSQATHLISVYGTDRPGIVFRTAHALADQGINITDLNTRILDSSGRYSGRSAKPIYVMLLEVQISSSAKAASLKRYLDRLGRSLRLNVTLQEIDPVSM